MSSRRLRLARSLLRGLVELTGEPFNSSVDTGKLRLQRRLHSRRLPLASGNASDVRPTIGAQLQLASNPAVKPGLQLESVEMGSNRHLPCTSHAVAVDLFENDSYVNHCQGEIVRKPSPVQLPELARRLKAARTEILKLSQRQFSNRIGASQSNISKWESGALIPEPEYLLKLSTILQGKLEGLYFIEAAGVPQAYLDGRGGYASGQLPTEFWTLAAAEQRKDFLYIPLLRDSAAAGTTRAIDDGEIESFGPIPRTWAPQQSALVAVRVVGDSMSPLIGDGSIVIIDTTKHDPKRLADRIVAARDGDGLTIKQLRRDGEVYMLVPHNTSRFPVTVLRPHDGWSIVGVVVNWIGFPSAGKL